jgi:ABC-type transport system involved in multi-copper enzyme maturation permease subunit
MTNTLPVVLREMRVLSRQPFSYRIRPAIALAGIAAWLVILTIGPARAHDKGLALLIFLCGMIMVMTMLAGVFLTADCISQEKREGTLGLLFLTDLRALDIVLGKMAANSAAAFFGFLAILPILSLPLLTGGVTGAETARIMLSLLLSLFLSLSVGIFISSVVVESRTAFSATLLAVLTLWVAPMAVNLLFQMVLRRTPRGNWFFELSPIFNLTRAFDNYYFFAPTSYWRSVTEIVLTGVGLLIWASLRVPVLWNKNEERAVSSKSETAAETESARPPLLRPWRARLFHLRSDLYKWISFRSSTLGRGTQTFLIALTVIWASLLLGSGSRLREGAFVSAFVTAFIVHVIVKFLLALEATRQIQSDSRGGVMELLLTTPLRERDIVLGQARAHFQRFRHVLLLLLGINVMTNIAVFAFYDNLHMGHGAAKVFSVFFMGGALTAIFDYGAIQWVGMWKALGAKTHLRGTYDTLKWILGVPWVVFPLLFAIAVSGRDEEGRLCVAMSFWFGLSIILDIWLMLRARRELRCRFRQLAGGG